MGNKYELLSQLLHIFPKNIETFYDLFGGSGVVSLNINAKHINYNELNQNIIELLKLFMNYKPEYIVSHIENRVKEFDLPTYSTDIRNPNIDKVKREQENKKYRKFRKFYNLNKNYLDLYTLTYFSFSNLIRFNSKSELNIPFGNRCFVRKEHKYIIEQGCYELQKRDIKLTNENAIDILRNTDFKQNDFIYLDPPYLNTEAVYNEKRAFGGWNIKNDYELFDELDKLNSKGIRWALSNVKENKGKKNKHLIKWANENNYRIIGMNKNYTALGKGNSNSYEVCIINYEYQGEGFKILQESLF